MEENKAGSGDEKFKSISISETGTPAKELYSTSSKPTTNIISALERLKENVKASSKDPHAPVHFLIDEFNSELLCQQYSMELADGLETNFKDSTVVITLQSVRKYRSIQTSDKKKSFQTEAMDTEPLLNAGVKEFKLKSSMRMSSQLHEMQYHLEDEAVKSKFKAPLTFKDSINNG